MKNFIQKLIQNKLVLGTFLLFLFFATTPHITKAAVVSFSSDYSSISVGDTVIVNVTMDTENKNPNVVEGDILIPSGAKNIKISELSMAGSVLTYWAKNPSLETNSKISFIGGVPKGFNQTSGLLFKIIFSATKDGSVVFSTENMKAYENDGKATPIEVSSLPFTIAVSSKKDGESKNQWLDVISKDKEIPQDLSVVMGQDASVFEGKKFISISASDAQSGIDYYEVKEGNWPTVRTGKTYVLLDQTESSAITVTAYDKAGNSSKILLTPGAPQTNYIKIGTYIVISLILFYGVFRFIKKRKKNG